MKKIKQMADDKRMNQLKTFLIISSFIATNSVPILGKHTILLLSLKDII